ARTRVAPRSSAWRALGRDPVARGTDTVAGAGPQERLRSPQVEGTQAAGTGRGIVHRSPPIIGTGCVRLLLCLNEPTVASPDPWVAGSGHYSHAGNRRGW
ncbi:MAG: DUF1826 domain-containing protein, partial [Rhodospirillales bacterium]|nr:DUF1826 domain-containing protein [Rhodospirillales bacterium]